MRKSFLTSLVLGCGAFLGLLSFGASALPIHVGLQNAGGQHIWTSAPFGDPSTLTLSGWENDNGAWVDANMVYNCPGGTNAQCPSSPLGTGNQPVIDPDTGLGITCNAGVVACNNNNEIGSTPWQMIDMNIADLSDWDSLSIALYGPAFNDDGPVGYLFAATCSVGSLTGISGSTTCRPSEVTSILSGNPVGSCSNASSVSCFFNVNKAFVDANSITDIWVMSSATNPSGSRNSNILLGGDFVLDEVSVPEPAALGIFGLGLLLIGAFVGLRRRETD